MKLIRRVIFIWLWRNARCQAQRSRGFTPAAVAPPDAITPEQVLRHYPLRSGAVRGDRHGPPPSSCQCCVYRINNPTEPFIYYFFLGFIVSIITMLLRQQGIPILSEYYHFFGKSSRLLPFMETLPPARWQPLVISAKNRFGGLCYF